ncbi:MULTISPECIES: sensor histidine kinase [Streptomyces]|uniref:histidine kinase n=1 Tax=Streptomyces thermoviolaceus subsp. thermoviolaceus TaxID=66860 RepID=A0ABX0YUX9_STRTL|nr:MULTISPECIES: sensor histidine kinase [Streptomyces]WTD48123.1 sensor histidine kinase [Streptomyces thermoviolaceus]NJP16427.1 sensor histidine kinase [Streptomyces thermoviolaceus subsp. thermoviolaceus]RSR99056.1 sensor histidine kinase [Streptomyces sp. WAC00469]GGV71155.1 histidine kinase [Streptomyces thermoviolaceus subsp. apingens]GHA85884.1 histidine kinase [Streptomyces thermoviolaceus subsp. thermoviolaceus]
MTTRQDAPPAGEGAGLKDGVLQTMQRAGAGIAQLTSGLSTGLLALLLVLWVAVTAVTSLVGIGLLMAPSVLRALHALAGRERARLGRWGEEVIAPDPPPTELRAALADPTTRRELRWLVRHATLGLLLGLIGALLPAAAVRDLTFPLYWPLAPEDATATSIGLGTAHSWPDALSVSLLGVSWVLISLGLTPGMARVQARPGRRLLVAGPEVDLSRRVAELTATRAAALDAHAVELRRIERALHDGTQNRIVSVTVLLGAARRMLARDPAGAEELLERAQSAAEQALAELRSVSRSILPPVLDDRGLEGALSALAANCAVPCRIDVDVPQRCAASVEATAYFVVAEALTNIAKHSGASLATVTVRSAGGRLRLRVQDDGRGGADENGGSGLTGMRRRVAAHDGTLSLTSPPGGPTTLQVELPCGS